MLKELEFYEDCDMYYDNDGYLWSYYVRASFYSIDCPTWWQIKVWLWNNRSTYIEMLGNIEDYTNYYFTSLVNAISKDIIPLSGSASPILAEILSIKEAVKHLHKQLTPIGNQ